MDIIISMYYDTHYNYYALSIMDIIMNTYLIYNIYYN